MEKEVFKKISDYKDFGYSAQYVAKECNCTIEDVMLVWHPEITTPKEIKEVFESEAHKAVIELYKTGLYKRAQISEMVKISASSVTRILDNVPIDVHRLHDKNKALKTREAEIKFFELFEKNYTLREVTQLLGCTITTTKNMKKSWLKQLTPILNQSRIMEKTAPQPYQC